MDEVLVINSTFPYLLGMSNQRIEMTTKDHPTLQASHFLQAQVLNLGPDISLLGPEPLVVMGSTH